MLGEEGSGDAGRDLLLGDLRETRQGRRSGPRIFRAQQRPEQIFGSRVRSRGERGNRLLPDARVAVLEPAAQGCGGHGVRRHREDLESPSANLDLLVGEQNLELGDERVDRFLASLLDQVQPERDPHGVLVRQGVTDHLSRLRAQDRHVGPAEAGESTFDRAREATDVLLADSQECQQEDERGPDADEPDQNQTVHDAHALGREDEPQDDEPGQDLAQPLLDRDVDVGFRPELDAVGDGHVENLAAGPLGRVPEHPLAGTRDHGHGQRQGRGECSGGEDHRDGEDQYRDAGPPPFQDRAKGQQHQDGQPLGGCVHQPEEAAHPIEVHEDLAGERLVLVVDELFDQDRQQNRQGDQLDLSVGEDLPELARGEPFVVPLAAAARIRVLAAPDQNEADGEQDDGSPRDEEEVRGSHALREEGGDPPADRCSDRPRGDHEGVGLLGIAGVVEDLRGHEELSDQCRHHQVVPAVERHPEYGAPRQVQEAEQHHARREEERDPGDQVLPAKPVGETVVQGDEEDDDRADEVDLIEVAGLESVQCYGISDGPENAHDKDDEEAERHHREQLGDVAAPLEGRQGRGPGYLGHLPPLPRCLLRRGDHRGGTTE